MRKTEFRTGRDAPAPRWDGAASRSNATAAAGAAGGEAGATARGKVRAIPLAGATVATAAGVASSERIPHSVAHAGRAALTTLPVPPFPWWQQGIVHSASAAHNGRTKRTPKTMSTPRPARARRRPGAFDWIGGRIVTLADKLGRGFIPVRARE